MNWLPKINFEALPSLTLKPYSESSESSKAAILGEHHFRMSDMRWFM
jgi:hypothetical protein